MRHRPGPGRTVGRPAARGLRGRRWSASIPTRTDAGWPRRPAPCSARRPTTKASSRWSRRCPGPRVALVPTGCSSWQAALPTSRWSWRRVSHATGPPSWTSASASSTCHGTTTTRRNSTSGSPARTDRVATTPGTKWTASTTRPGYVRWTERRNLQCFVNAVARKEVDPEPLIAGIFPLRDAPSVYEQLGTGDLRGVGFLFEYDVTGESIEEFRVTVGSAVRAPSIRRPTPCLRVDTPVRPHGRQQWHPADRLCRRRELRLFHAPSAPRASSRASNWRTSPLAARCQPSMPSANSVSGPPAPIRTAVFEDDSIDAVFIVTRHSAHADMTCRGTRGGKGGLRREAAGSDG